MTATGPAADASRMAHQAANSKTLERIARLGFASRGFVYVFIGVVAVRIALGGAAGEEADQKGALQSLAGNGAGIAVLWLIALGFLGYAVWRGAEAAIGHRGESDPKKRTLERVASGVRVVIYLALAFSAVSIAQGGAGGEEGDSLSAQVMGMTGGRLVVGLVGLVIAGVGVYLFFQAMKNDYAEDLETSRMGPTLRTWALRLGRFGYAARGVAFTVLGVLVLLSAVQYDPEKAEGLDAALKTLASAPFGAVILTVVGLGLAAFGVYSFVESRYRRIDTV